VETAKNDLLKRLRRIEGQIKGIHKMIETEQTCNDILIQISAVKAAINKVGGLVLENYSKTCIKKAIMEEEPSENIEHLIDTIIKYSK
jgi:CsoR family transcriptional regulator, copper-sensing transcriptional repressor